LVDNVHGYGLKYAVQINVKIYDLTGIFMWVRRIEMPTFHSEICTLFESSECMFVVEERSNC